MSKKIKYKNIIVYTYTKIYNKKSNKKIYTYINFEDNPEILFLQ